MRQPAENRMYCAEGCLAAASQPASHPAIQPVSASIPSAYLVQSGEQRRAVGQLCD